MIVQNEAQHLPRVLESVSWADEIVVVDGGSTDRSREIAMESSKAWSAKIRWIDRKWSGFRDQRNASLDATQHPWVLVIDADESCSPELRDRILQILSRSASGEKVSRYYKVRRQEYFLGKPIHFGVWNPSFQDRFFQKDGIRYINEIHEYPPYPETPERLQEPLHHWPQFHPEKFLEKMNKYTSIEARARVDSGYRTNLIHMVLAGPAMFLKNYFYYRAYRDGVHGLVISILEGVSRAVRHVKIWSYQNDRS
jgi:glycosyltransferase involved in cell wall biosynthesis